MGNELIRQRKHGGLNIKSKRLIDTSSHGDDKNRYIRTDSIIVGKTPNV